LGQSPSEEDINKMINEVDGDRNGSIEFPEFLKMMASRHRSVDTETEIKEAFTIFANKGGEYITADTLAKSMNSLKESFGDSDIATMIKISGTDGKVSYSQFKNMMLSK
jgi:Ca2+-binding EF-hand superfamily protein